MNYVGARKKLVDWLRKQLIGPAIEGSLNMSPLDRYPTGVLHPVDTDLSGVDPASSGEDIAERFLLEDDDEDDAASDNDETSEAAPARAARRRRHVPPSSAGLSFFLRENTLLSIKASAATYRGADERDDQGRFLTREYTREELDELITTLPGAVTPGERRTDIWEGRASIDVRSRPHCDGWIITVTLCNRGELDPSASPKDRIRDRVSKSLFEARLECVVESGALAEYPRVDPSLLTDEELELELQYQHQRIYAVGHGAAVNWTVEPKSPPRIWCDFMPEAQVPMMTVNTGGDDAVLRLSHLADRIVPEELAGFVEGYAQWIADQKRTAETLSRPEKRDAAKRMLNRMGTARDRMRACVEMLRTDPVAIEAFRLANEAMLNQMRQADENKGEEPETDAYRWRPFQLAFLLTVMVSAIRENDDYRDVLDLIWFPTGGGKTEAYLGLIAFLIAWRRQKHPASGGGTTAFMRYTLRLLTRQQFERAARMVCALELMRRCRPDQLGEAPINIGIWVGQKISPNRYEEAKELVAEIRDGKPGAEYNLLMERCPWCDAPFDAAHGYRATNHKFHFHCTAPDCSFGADDRPLPCNVVDDALYDEPPSLLIGTIDKFARLAWEERTGAFFGVNNQMRPPELIIQDELHLITGPLGSVAGLYEAGIDTLLIQRGVRPKYVASTATIRMAREQVQRLYARDLAVFPPPGLTHDDMYFASTDRERPGRLYVGYLAPMLDQQHCLAPLAAALLAAPTALFDDDLDEEGMLDAYWTQIIYHGSLKGVGTSLNAFGTQVRDFGRRLAYELRQANEGALGQDFEPTEEDTDAAQEFDAALARFDNPQIDQLTSRKSARENAETFRTLDIRQRNEGCLDAVMATNMVSVGLDVARLALMIVNGQPLTTAEYIQATSRVGRAEVPGLVVANYYRHQARSLSHYESFRPYHESFYRFVEPGSVTPFTYQVRSRALHAALVIALRHSIPGLQSNKSAGQFDRESHGVRAVLSELKRRCGRAVSDPNQVRGIESHLDQLADQWGGEARRCKEERRQLSYQAQNSVRNADRLLYTHGEPRPGLWATLHSMRNVEGTGSLKIHDWPYSSRLHGERKFPRGQRAAQALD